MSTPAAEAPAYRALALQLVCDTVNGFDADAALQRRLATVERIARQVPASLAFLGRDTRLVVLPEYALTGFPLGDPVERWAATAASAPDGPEVERLGAVAQASRIHLAVNLYETDPFFPGLYFQASLVLGPTGDVVLRYRRLHSLFSPSPYDVWSRYLDRYGLDGVLPVARTELGGLAALASEEVLFPELARALALRGAEVFVHSTSEAGSPLLTPKDVAKRARAIENVAAVVSANSGGLRGIDIPAASTDGGSQVVDHTGAVLAQAGPGESMVAAAELDLAALRRARHRPGMANLLARVKTGLWAEIYAGLPGEPPDGLAGGAPDRPWFARRHAAVITRLQEMGAIT